MVSFGLEIVKMNKDQIDNIVEQWIKERPDLEAGAGAIIDRISRIYRLVDQRFQNIFAGHNLNRGEFEVLAALRRAGLPFTLTPTDLFQALMLSSGAMTNRIDQLEKAGLVIRKPDPADRRGVLVTLTEQGRQLIDEVLKVYFDSHTEMIKTFTPEEQETLSGLLRKFIHTLE